MSITDILDEDCGVGKQIELIFAVIHQDLFKILFIVTHFRLFAEIHPYSILKKLFNFLFDLYLINTEVVS